MIEEMEFSVPEVAKVLHDLLVDHRYREYPVGRTIARYIEYMRSEWGATERTLEDYANVLDKLALEYPDLELADFDGRAGGTEILRQFIASRWGHVSPSTRGKVISTLKSFFRWCLECDLVEVDPAAKLRRPRRRGSERRAHDPREIQALIRAQPQLRDRVAISLMARLGLRKNELRLLRWADIDLDQREVRIHGKGGKVVDVPIPYDDLRTDLAQLEREQDAEQKHYLLYPVHVGNVRAGGGHLRGIVREDRSKPMEPSTMHRWWKRCLKTAGTKDFPMHELRHTAGTEFHRAAKDLKLTQMFMRHASISTTADAYLHLDQDDLKRGMRLAGERWQSTERKEDPDGSDDE